MDGEAANADAAGPDAWQGVVRHTGGSVACLSRRAQQQGESLVGAVGENVPAGSVAPVAPCDGRLPEWRSHLRAHPPSNRGALDLGIP